MSFPHVYPCLAVSGLSSRTLASLDGLFMLSNDMSIGIGWVVGSKALPSVVVSSPDRPRNAKKPRRNRLPIIAAARDDLGSG